MKKARSLILGVDSQFRRARPGSILILVVTLLVLMALLGTAFLLTARNERVSSKLYQHNIQVDMLLDGVVSLAETIVSDTSYQSVPVNTTANPPYVPANPTPVVPAAPYSNGQLVNPSQRYDDSFTTAKMATYYGTPGSFPYLQTPNTAPNPLPTPSQLPSVGVDHTWLASRYPVWSTYQPMAVVPGTNNTLTPIPVPSGTSSSLLDLAGSVFPMNVVAGSPALSLYPYPLGAVVGIPNGPSFTYYLNTCGYMGTVPLNLIPSNGSAAANPNYYQDHLYADVNDLNPPATPPKPAQPPAPYANPATTGWVQLNSSAAVTINAGMPPVTGTPTINYVDMSSGPITLNTPAVWPTVSGPLSSTWTFEDPRYNASSDVFDVRYPTSALPAPVTPTSPYYPTVGPPPNTTVRPDGVRWLCYPTWVPINGTNYPGLYYYSTVNSRFELALAASASGDGIADAFLARLPTGTIDGITYYAAVRIVDNAAAINVNTANSMMADFRSGGYDNSNFNPSANTNSSAFAYPSGSYPADFSFLPGMFPASVGLETMLADFNYNNTSAFFTHQTVTYPFPTNSSGSTSDSDFLRLYEFRLGNLATDANPTGLTSVPGVFPDSTNNPWDEFIGAQRADFQYRSEGEALWAAIGRRLTNPGFFPYKGGFRQYRAFTWDDAAALAYRNDLVSPYASPSAIEQVLLNTTYQPMNPGNLANLQPEYPQRPYSSTTDVSNWMMNCYPAAPPGANIFTLKAPAHAALINRRPYLTARNPVNISLPAHAIPGYAPLGGAAPVAAIPFSNYTSPSFNQSAMVANLAALMGGTKSNGFSYTSPADAPSGYIPKVSLNTADITGQDVPPVTPAVPANSLGFPAPTAPNLPNSKGPSLWLGFYNAMADYITSANNTSTVTPQFNYQYVPYLPPYNMPYVVSGIDTHQFRSPIRDPMPGGVSYAYTDLMQTMLLRSLIAAVNAKDLRDSDDIPTHVQAAYQVPGSANQMPVPVLSAYVRPLGSNTSAPPPPSSVPAAAGTTALPVVDFHVFGTERQVYITEVYVNTETTAPATSPNSGKSNPRGYICVQLFNPSDSDIDLTGWTLGVVDRSTFPFMTMYSIPGFPGFGGKYVSGTLEAVPATSGVASTIIKSHSLMILENLPQPSQATGTNPAFDAKYRPFKAYANATPFMKSTAGTAFGATAAPSAYPSGLPAYNCSNAPASTPFVTLHYVPNLDSILYNPNAGASPYGGGTKSCELVLLRPAVAAGAAATFPSSALNTATPFSYLMATQMAPVDSFDTNGITFFVNTGAGTQFQSFHYVRNTNLSSITSNWKFVFPGRYTANKWNASNVIAVGTYNTGQNSAPQEGIVASPTYTQTGPDPWSFGSTPSIQVGDYSAAASYPESFTIQLANTDFGGPSKVNTNNVGPVLSTKTTLLHPFGGFARTGDVLQTPYIGSYTILQWAGTSAAVNLPAQIIEINPVTIDSSFADDADGGPGPNIVGADDGVEQIGRFCPLAASDPMGFAYAVGPGKPDYYDWSKRVLDCFTAIGNPHDDYAPNIDPNPNNYGPQIWNPALKSYVAGGPANVPSAVNNLGLTGAPNQMREDTAGVDGMININTADVTVLSRVPWVPVLAGYDSVTRTNSFNVGGDNWWVAKAIVTYRNTYGPFKTLFDLNRVPMSIGGVPCPFNSPLNLTNGKIVNTFQDIFGDSPTVDYPAYAGNISPTAHPQPIGVGTAPLPDHNTNDFETRFGSIIRLSNILTTRSDTYTIYALVQGWTGVGSKTPTIVSQRRAAVIVDRSAMSATSLNPLGVHLVPTD